MKLIDTVLIKLWSAQHFSSYVHKMAAGGPYWFLIFAKIDRGFRPYVINGCVKYEFGMSIGVRRWRRYKYTLLNRIVEGGQVIPIVN